MSSGPGLNVVGANVPSDYNNNVWVTLRFSKAEQSKHCSGKNMSTDKPTYEGRSKCIEKFTVCTILQNFHQNKSYPSKHSPC